MRRMFVLSTALVCCLSLGFAFAGGETCAQKAAVASKSGCCASEGFPSMAMMVGEKSYGCPVEAGKAASASKAKVVYVVGTEKFDCQEKAYGALADASESYVRKYTTLAAMVDGKVMFSDDCAPAGCCAAVAAKTGASCCAEKAKDAAQTKTVKAEDKGTATCTGNKEATQTKTVKAEEKTATCGEKSTGVTGTTVAAKSGEGCCASKANAVSHPVRIAEAEMKALKNAKYMIAGRTFDKYEDAARTRDQVRTAIKKVAMKYEVDGKQVDSADKVCPMAKKDGKVQFVVADKKTKCEIDARICLAKAQYEAARTANGEKVAKM